MRTKVFAMKMKGTEGGGLLKGRIVFRPNIPQAGSYGRICYRIFATRNKTIVTLVV